MLLPLDDPRIETYISKSTTELFPQMCGSNGQGEGFASATSAVTWECQFPSCLIERKAKGACLARAFIYNSLTLMTV